MRDLELLVHRDVEQETIVVNAPPAEDRRAVVVVHRVGKTEPRLYGAVERRPIAAVADVAGTGDLPARLALRWVGVSYLRTSPSR